ncbi:helix-turn-helix domain-containing protein [Cytobacillus firmus]|uniref:helix-turn-helix domain-containing protein n=1 Tax=Cytobacillus firmus TaxID=1399 RepID=UPI00077CAFF4|nr:helix-turn-helix domain-containing protein [Cytobacillus firmus]MBG9542056.1 XRE family transcriptional regulator [Cytobacillus firmus]MBG9551630.1 XRE family transcriptional regulator [Cytobacillus firmus]MBG9556657.1 XRE family transcriptional regulator [Cytobacillus firmus]MBG9576048.1 XRE family transcriptional regulator [Cytobacillus firmus]MBG9657472.1 XRE family transcriptional regulator [Cytobacillus firmus]
MTELGNRLKEARLAKDMNLDDLQKVTKIQKRYLVGIEEGDYSMMPGKFYVRAFIKQYAEAVGIEPEEIFEQYKDDIPSQVNDDIPEKLSRVQSRKDLSGRTSKVFDILPKVLIGVFIVGLIAVLYNFLGAKDQADNEEKPSDLTDEQTVIEESENLAENKKDESAEKKEESADKDAAEENGKDQEAEEEPKQEVAVVQSSGNGTVYELKNADKFELEVLSTGETWVNIKNGKGDSLFQGMLTADGKKSQKVDFSKETEASIVVGNSTQTEIFVNGEKIEYKVPPSQSVKQDITIKYAPKSE